MPRDVATRWNSTYDMLVFALDHRKAIEIMSADRENGLRSFELSSGEWRIVAQLCDILKVCARLLTSIHVLLTPLLPTDTQGGDSLLLPLIL